MNRAQEFLTAFAWGLICAIASLCASMLVDHLDYPGMLEISRAILLRCAGFVALLLGARWMTNAPIAERWGFMHTTAHDLGRLLWLIVVVFCIQNLIGRSTLDPSWIIRGAMFAMILISIAVIQWRRAKSAPKSAPTHETAGSMLVLLAHGVLACILFLWINHPSMLGRAGVMGGLVGIAAAGVIYASVNRKRPGAIVPIYILLMTLMALIPMVLGIRRALEYAQWSLEASGEAPQKILLITVDTLRADSVFPTDGSEPNAPNLRRFAEANLHFNHAVSVAPWTLPTFTSILTGMDPAVHGVGRANMKIPHSMRTLPEILEEQNYLTAAIVFNYWLSPVMHVDQGFREYNFVDTKHVQEEVALVLRDFGIKTKPTFARSETDKITEWAIRWLRANEGRRYFLWLHYLDPHMPYAPPDGYLTDDTDRRLGLEFEAPAERTLEPVSFPPEKQKWIRELYRGETAYVDACIGRVFDELKQSGDYEDALIIFTSDHGEEFWEHGAFEHGHAVYEEVMHVPLAIKLPGAERAIRLDQPVVTPQVFPTILELLDLPVDPNMVDYASLTPMIEDRATTATMSVLHSGSVLYGDDRDVVYAHGMKFIRNAATSRVELYDLATDPREQRDLAAKRPESILEFSTLVQSKYDAALATRERRGIIYDPYDNRVSDEVVENLQKLGYMR